MALPFVIALTVLVYLKPQELWPLLRAVPILYVVFTLAVVGLVVDIARGALAATLPASGPYVLAFAAFGLVDVAVHDVSSIPRFVMTVGIGVGTYLAVAIGLGAPGRVQAFAALLLALAVALAAIGAHQSMQPFVCFSLDHESSDADAPAYDGRACTHWHDCSEDASVREDLDWLCERPGLFGTTSIGHGRVRYRGSLADPNELSLVIGTALPFAFALGARKAARLRVLLLLGVLGLSGWCIIQTGSRGGQLVFATVIGLFFIRRFRLLGAFVGAIAALPVILLGGRSGAEADASAIERIEAWNAGMGMVDAHPLFGVGPGLFTDHHIITAHNAYVLVVAETGMVGLFLFTLSIYATLKIPASLWWHRDPRLDPRLAVLAPAVLVALVGMLIGIFFLSFAYHHVLYLFMGLSGALGLAARRTVPEQAAPIGWREAAVLFGIDLAFVGAMHVYTHLRVG